jgi:hypothetical protein
VIADKRAQPALAGQQQEAIDRAAGIRPAVDVVAQRDDGVGGLRFDGVL